jgi:hypothetical protein
MRVRQAGLVALTILAAGCAGLQPPEQNAAQLAALAPPAAQCEPTLPFFGFYRYSRDERPQYVEPDGRIVMGNDGGWCVIRYQVMTPNGGFATTEAEIRKEPAHGSVIVGTLDGLLRIAYRPAPGFVGEDGFAVYLRGPVPYLVPIKVWVRS